MTEKLEERATEFSAKCKEFMDNAREKLNEIAPTIVVAELLPEQEDKRELLTVSKYDEWTTMMMLVELAQSYAMRIYGVHSTVVVTLHEPNDDAQSRCVVPLRPEEQPGFAAGDA